MTKEEVKEYNRQYYLKNKEKIKRQNKEWRDNNKDYMKQYNKDYSIENVDKLNFHKEKYKINNPDKIKESKDKWLGKNKQKRKDWYNKYRRERRTNDDIYRLIDSIRCIINTSFRNGKFKKQSRTHDILGCSFDEFKIYIESKFEYWMNWSNHGKYTGEYNETWQYDHIIPISSASTYEELIKLNHYTNFQPLCSKKNLEKSNLPSRAPIDNMVQGPTGPLVMPGPIGLTRNEYRAFKLKKIFKKL